MRYARALTVVLIMFGSSALAADLGRATGSVTIDGKPIVLQYAYAVDHQKNQLSNKSNETRIVLTDKPLPDGTKLDDIENTFPDGTYGVVVGVRPNDHISHVFGAPPTGRRPPRLSCRAGRVAADRRRGCRSCWRRAGRASRGRRSA